MTDEEKAKEYVKIKSENLRFCQNRLDGLGCVLFEEEDMELAHLDGLAEGRKELEKENAELKKETKRLSTVDETNELLLKHQNSLKKEVHDLRKENEEQKTQIEKMKSFIHSEIDFCIYCPLTNGCRNDEGTCPYAYATEEEQKNLLLDFINKSGS